MQYRLCDKRPGNEPRSINAQHLFQCVSEHTKKARHRKKDRGTEDIL